MYAEQLRFLFNSVQCFLCCMCHFTFWH